MRINLSALETTSKKETEPISLFTSIAGGKNKYLRHEQGQILEEWYRRRDESDVLICQTTGGGKTLIGLLIALSSMYEQKKPSVYLVADSYLVRQVLAEAKACGIPTAVEPSEISFINSEAILVTTYQKLFNGLTKFGTLDAPSNFDLGAIIFDDAHRAIDTLENQLTLTISGSSEPKLYDALIDLFKNDIEMQLGEVAFIDFKERKSTRSVRISPKFINDNISNISTLLDNHLSDELRFIKPILSRTSELSNFTIADGRIEVASLCPYINYFTGFAKSRRRVYMTATLLTTDSLVSHFNILSGDRLRAITPSQGDKNGVRLILTPLHGTNVFTDDSIRELAYKIAYGENFTVNSLSEDVSGTVVPKTNVVVLVPTHKHAKLWEPYTKRHYTVDTLEDAVASLKAGPQGITVLINKYDGVDLPHDACRLLIIDGTYVPHSPIERRRASIMPSSIANRHKAIVRLEQGLGRAIRDRSDYAAVIVMDTSNSELLLRNDSIECFTDATGVHIKISNEIVNRNPEIYEDIANLEDVIRQFLDPNSDFAKDFAKLTRTFVYKQDYVFSDEVIARRKAFNHAIDHDFQKAKDILYQFIMTLAPNEEGSAERRGFLFEDAATYALRISDNAYQSTLSRAHACNHRFLRPTDIHPSRRPDSLTLSQAKNIIKEHRSDSSQYSIEYIEKLFKRIAWGISGTSAEAEKAVRDLGRRLGVIASLRDSSKEKGPDVLWMLNDYAAVFELKTCVHRDDKTISKSEVQQLTYALHDYLPQAHGNFKYRFGVLIHPYTRLGNNVQMEPSKRLLSPRNWNQLRQAFCNFARDLESIDLEAKQIADLLMKNKLDVISFIDTFTEEPKSFA